MCAPVSIIGTSEQDTEISTQDQEMQSQYYSPVTRANQKISNPMYKIHEENIEGPA